MTINEYGRDLFVLTFLIARPFTRKAPIHQRISSCGTRNLMKIMNKYHTTDVSLLLLLPFD
jgi:hypothetical protein